MISAFASPTVGDSLATGPLVISLASSGNRHIADARIAIFYIRIGF